MDLTTIARDGVSVVRLVGPVLAAAGGVLLAAQLLTDAGRARLRLARRGLSGGRRSWGRRLLVGTLVPTLGVSALCVSLALEQEVREGPNRMLDQLQTESGPAAWILQTGSGHLMDESHLPAAAVTTGERAGAVPVWEQLALVGRPGSIPDTGLVLASANRGLTPSPISPPVDPASAACPVVAQTCLLRPGQAIVDSQSAPVGTTLVVRGQALTVVAHTTKPYSLLNRTVLFTNPALFHNGTSMSAPYALLVGGPDPLAHAHAIAAASGVGAEVEVLSAAQVKQANSRFWAGNGTPLLLLIIALSAAFCGVALYAGRRATQQRERVALGTLLALGLRPGQACGVDLLRALSATVIATTLAWPTAVGMVALTNAGMIGFHATVSVAMAAAAVGLLVAADTLGTVALWLRLRGASITASLQAT